MNRFRSVTLALRPFVDDVYNLTNAADAVVALDLEIPKPEMPVVKSPDGHATYNWTTRLWDYEHSYLVDVARNNDALLAEMAQNKKINAIKELRMAVPGAGLRVCKEAVEDTLVSIAASLRADPWSIPPEDPNPF